MSYSKRGSKTAVVILLKSYLVSWHLCTWVHFLARCKIHANKYVLLQFPKEMITTGSKTQMPYLFMHCQIP